jgi:hypothetical protein
MSDDKVILFPTNAIRNPEKVGSVNPEQHARIAEQKTKEFVEATTDDIAYTLCLIPALINLSIKV